MEQLFKQVQEAQKELGAGEPLFRGHSSIEFKLLPTLFRLGKGKSQYERTIFYKYKSLSRSLNKELKSNWDLMLDMQHYGLPTRLLDWTSCLGSALYFALQGNVESPCIWLLNPHCLNQASTGTSLLFDVSTAPDIGGQSDFNASEIMAGNCEYTIPYAFSPPHGNARISAQRGLFTVHMKSEEPLEVQCPNSVIRIDIPLESVEKYKKQLNLLGIDDFHMFPDQVGLAKYLKNVHGF